MNKPKIINCSAMARHGKDSSARILKEKLELEGCRVLITHYADWLKQLSTQLYGTTLEHNSYNRTKWQELGHQARMKNHDYWVNHVIEFVKVFGDSYDFIIVPDCRYVNEQKRWEEENFDLISLHITRLKFDNGLTEEQKAHPSEHGLDDFVFDYYVEAENLEELELEVLTFIDYLEKDIIISAKGDSCV